ncbi:hypothetical protein BJX96DRAFT_160215 [Aspergillus floccosus]
MWLLIQSMATYHIPPSVSHPCGLRRTIVYFYGLGGDAAWPGRGYFQFFLTFFFFAAQRYSIHTTSFREGGWVFCAFWGTEVGGVKLEDILRDFG